MCFSIKARVLVLTCILVSTSTFSSVPVWDQNFGKKDGVAALIDAHDETLISTARIDSLDQIWIESVDGFHARNVQKYLLSGKLDHSFAQKGTFHLAGSFYQGEELESCGYNPFLKEDNRLVCLRTGQLDGDPRSTYFYQMDDRGKLDPYFGMSGYFSVTKPNPMGYGQLQRLKDGSFVARYRKKGTASFLHFTEHGNILNQFSTESAYAAVLEETPSGQFIYLTLKEQNGEFCTELRRFNRDGSLDITFPDKSYKTPGNLNLCKAIKSGIYTTYLSIDRQGRILLSGTNGEKFPSDGLKAVVVRLTPEGLLDPTFNSKSVEPGIWEGGFGRYGNWAKKVHQDKNGEYVFQGTFNDTTSMYTGESHLIRLTPQGEMDATFNSSGANPGRFILKSPSGWGCDHPTVANCHRLIGIDSRGGYLTHSSGFRKGIKAHLMRLING